MPFQIRLSLPHWFWLGWWWWGNRPRWNGMTCPKRCQPSWLQLWCHWPIVLRPVRSSRFFSTKSSQAVCTIWFLSIHEFCILMFFHLLIYYFIFVIGIIFGLGTAATFYVTTGKFFYDVKSALCNVSFFKRSPNTEELSEGQHLFVDQGGATNESSALSSIAHERKPHYGS